MAYFSTFHCCFANNALKENAAHDKIFTLLLLSGDCWLGEVAGFFAGARRFLSFFVEVVMYLVDTAPYDFGL